MVTCAGRGSEQKRRQEDGRHLDSGSILADLPQQPYNSISPFHHVFSVLSSRVLFRTRAHGTRVCEQLRPRFPENMSSPREMLTNPRCSLDLFAIIIFIEPPRR